MFARSHSSQPVCVCVFIVVCLFCFIDTILQGIHIQTKTMQTASNLAIRGIRAGPLPKQLQQPTALSFYFTVATVLATSSVRQVGHWARCQGRLAGSPLLGGTQMQSPLLGGTLVESPVLLDAGRGRLVRSPVLQVPVRDLRGKETTTADLPVSSLKTSHLASQPLEVAKKNIPPARHS